MNITFDRNEHNKQKTILREAFPDYDPRHHDVFVWKYNKMLEDKTMREYMKERGII